MRLPLMGRATRRLVLAIAVTAAMAATMLSSPAAYAGGPDGTLCHQDTSRVKIPSNFTVNACFDGSVLTLRNRTSVVVRVYGTGDIHGSVRNSDVPSISDVLTTLITDDDVIPPGSYLQLWLGSNTTDIEIEIALDANRKYDLYELLLSYLPGVSGYEDVAAAVESISAAFADRETCDAKATNWLGKVGCAAGMAGNISFAVGKLALQLAIDVPGALVKALIDTVWDAWDQYGHSDDLDTIANSTTMMHIAAATGPSTSSSQSPPAPSLPAQPTNPNVVSTTVTSAALTWTDASNNEDSFVSQYRVGSGPWMAGPSAGANATSMTVTGLAAGTSYTFQVGARNSAGTHWSAYFYGTTAQPPSAFHGGFAATVDKYATTGLSGHKGPGDQYAAGPTYPAGTTIHIYCYVNGQSITNSHYNDTTTVWDLSDDGYWYTDAWLFTNSNGAVVPACR